MKLSVDPEADALYLELNQSKVLESEEVEPGIILDFDAEGNAVGVEILHLSKRLAPHKTKVLELEVA